MAGDIQRNCGKRNAQDHPKGTNFMLHSIPPFVKRKRQSPSRAVATGEGAGKLPAAKDEQETRWPKVMA